MRPGAVVIRVVHRLPDLAEAINACHVLGLRDVTVTTVESRGRDNARALRYELTATEAALRTPDEAAS